MQPVDEAVLTFISANRPSPLTPLDGRLPEVDAVARERGYKNRDVITVTKEGRSNLYKAELLRGVRFCRDIQTLIRDHVLQDMHEDEDIRISEERCCELLLCWIISILYAVL